MPATAQDQSPRREPRLVSGGDQRRPEAGQPAAGRDAGLGSLAAKLLSEAKARVLDSERRLPNAPNPAAAQPRAAAQRPPERSVQDARLQVQGSAPAAANPLAQASAARNDAIRGDAAQLRSVANVLGRAKGAQQPGQPPRAQSNAAGAPQRSQLRPVPRDEVEPEAPGAQATPERASENELSALDWPGKGAPVARHPRDSVLNPRGNAMTARHYVQSLNARLREEKTSQMRNAMSQVEREEINALIRMLARMRGRHAALLLELAKTDRPIKNQMFDELQSMRKQIEEMEAGLELLKSSILDGSINVRGVRAEEM